MISKPHFSPDLIAKYGMSGPRYTSYPTAVQFHEGFDEVVYRLHVEQSNEELIPRPLSLYLHMPFCRSLCYYCGCNKKITQHARRGAEYLGFLDREMEMQARLFDRDRKVVQLHFGGGTPTFFDDFQLQGTMDRLAQHFSLDQSESREFSIEIDPRTVDPVRLGNLANMGFNRLSLGIQDFDPAVQAAVNRIQSKEETLELIRAARETGFDSVSVDLIYGLPLQSTASFAPTIDAVLSERPDRISVYNYAHMPQLFRAQRLIRTEDLPSPETRLQLLEHTIERLTGEGYEYIGMDHFALPEDELARARRNGSLQRNFQGYSTGQSCDLVGLGVSAIGKVGNCYVQNRKDLRAWQADIKAGNLPVWRGISLGPEDVLRRHVIGQIMCQGQVDYEHTESLFNVDFTECFAPEMVRLEELAGDGLLTLGEDGFSATGEGLLLLRVIAMVFDDYIPVSGSVSNFSKVI